MTELEMKLLLTEDEYDYLTERLVYENPSIQNSITTHINYYFDTDDFSMNRQNTTCRIRLNDGKYKATMKKHSSDDYQSTETEMEIYNGLESNAFTAMGLKLQGELVTKRCVVFKDANCEAVLDKNEYLGHTDYELEIEYVPEHEKEAQAILKIFRDMLTRRKCFLAYKESIEELLGVPSKSTRFFERKLVTKETSEERKSKTDDQCFETRNESVQKTNIASFNAINSFDYSKPDDYMNDYYHSKAPLESVCTSCIYFSGRHCGAPSGRCDYEEY